MPEFIMSGKDEPSFQALDAFTQGYIEALFFTDSGDSDDEIQEQGFSDFHPDSLAAVIDECKRFQDENLTELENAYSVSGYGEAQAGHDFWLTRNGHGAGFWDRQLGDVGDTLTAACKAYGECYPGLTDDGKVWID